MFYGSHPPDMLSRNVLRIQHNRPVTSECSMDYTHTRHVTSKYSVDKIQQTRYQWMFYRSHTTKTLPVNVLWLTHNMLLAHVLWITHNKRASSECFIDHTTKHVTSECSTDNTQKTCYQWMFDGSRTTNVLPVNALCLTRNRHVTSDALRMSNNRLLPNEVL